MLPELWLYQLKLGFSGSPHLLIAEPKGHVTPEEFGVTRSIALDLELEIGDAPELRRSHTMLLEKPGVD
jgi:hypothetical protein